MGLIFGDCIEQMKLLKDNSIDLCLTGPPYGTTACKWDNVIPFAPMWLELKRIVKDNGAICLFGAEPFSSRLRMSNIKMFKYDWVWEKNKSTGHLNANRMPMNSYEIISLFYKRLPKYLPLMGKGSSYSNNHKAGDSGDCYGNVKESNRVNVKTRYPKRNIKFNVDIRAKFHPTQKPVALLEYLIKTYTLENETVLDFTMGSGSTGVAAKNLNRKFIGIELDKEYFDIATKRIKGAS